MENERSDVSDYLINGLTTQIANRGRGKIKLVSRQVLDRIMAEFSFQLSDLTSMDTQLQVGNQLGASLILTGFITPLTNRYKLNAQLVEVETGTNQQINLRRMDGGYTGNHLSVQMRIGLTADFQDFLDREETLGLSIYAVVGKPWGTDYDTLSFSIRSDVLQQGSLDIYDYDGEEYYYADIGANPIWTRVRLPFEELISDAGSLADTSELIEQAVLSFYFDIPHDALKYAITEGFLDLSLDLDDFTLE